MNFRILATTALLLPLLLTGCLEYKSSSEEHAWGLDQPAPAPTPLSEVELNVTKLSESNLADRNDYTYTLGFNQHRIAFTVPHEYAGNMQIKRWHSNISAYEQTEFQSVNLGTAGVIMSEWLDVGGYSLETQEYTYQLSYGNGLTKSFSLSIKPDLKIVGIVHASELRTRNLNLDLDTVYIAPNSALITDGKPLRLTAKNVLSRGGIYTDETQASGGTIILNIEKLYGSLDVKVGKDTSFSNRLQINVKELAPWRYPESCGIYASMVSDYLKPRVSIERNLCTGQ